MRSATGWALLIVATVGIAYANTLRVPMLLDDLPAITTNATIRHLSHPGEVLRTPPYTGVSGRPLLNLTYAINYAIGGLSVGGYHAMNLLIHAAAALALFGVVRRILEAPALGGRYAGRSRMLAGCTALLWAVHPILTGAVTYISERAEILMGLFYLLTIYCFLRSAVAESPTRWRALSIAACLAGVATKETIVSAPAIVLVIDAIFYSGGFGAALRRRRAYYACLGGAWLVLAAFMLFLARRSVGFERSVGPGEYAATECRAILLYLRLSVWPHPLIFDYGPVLDAFSPAALASAAAVAALLLATAILAWKRPVAALPAIWFWVILAPTSSFVPVALQPVAESRMYLPLAGIVAAVVLMAHRWARRWTWAPVAVLAAAGVAGTAIRNEAYATPLSIWSDTVAKRPRNARAQDWLGNCLVQSGRYGQAVPHYVAALELTPNVPQIRFHLADAEMALGDYAGAEQEFERALQLSPGSAEANRGLGFAEMQRGEYDAARAHFQSAARADPTDAESHLCLANLLAMAGRLPEAMAEWRTALKLRPNDPQAHNNLGMALAQSGRWEEALQEYRAALAIDPAYPQARNNLSDLEAQLAARNR